MNRKPAPKEVAKLTVDDLEMQTLELNDEIAELRARLHHAEANLPPTVAGWDELPDSLKAQHRAAVAE